MKRITINTKLNIKLIVNLIKPDDKETAMIATIIHMIILIVAIVPIFTSIM